MRRLTLLVLFMVGCEVKCSSYQCPDDSGPCHDPAGDIVPPMPPPVTT